MLGAIKKFLLQRLNQKKHEVMKLKWQKAELERQLEQLNIRKEDLRENGANALQKNFN